MPRDTETFAARLRIVVVAPHFAEYALRYAEALAQSATVLLIADGSNLAREVGDEPRPVAANLKVTTYPFRPRRKMYRNLGGLLFAIAAFRPSAIHFQEVPDTVNGLVMSVFGRRVPCVLTVHDPVPHSGRDAAITPARRRWRDRARRRAAAVVLHGAHCVAAFSALPDAAGQRLVESAHGIIMAPGAAQRRAPVPGRVLFFGRMEAYKGLDTLVAAAELLERRAVPHEIMVAGRGPELDRLRGRVGALPGLRVEDRYLTPADAIAAFQEASVVVLPYHDASQSGVAAAAFANGRPVIASRVGGLCDVVADGENGLLVPPRDAAALADAIAAVLTGPDLRAALAAGACRTAESRLAWPRIAAEMIDLYHGLGPSR